MRLAFADSMGMSIGFGFALFCLGASREILGYGSLFGIPLFGSSFEPWVVMILPPGGFLMLGMILMLFNALGERQRRINNEREDSDAEGKEVAA